MAAHRATFLNPLGLSERSSLMGLVDFLVLAALDADEFGNNITVSFDLSHQI